MKYFCMPADFKKDTIDKYEKLNQSYTDSRVIETYGNITVGNISKSGRSVDLLPVVDLEKLREYIRYSEGKNIDFNYTLNASTLENKEFTKNGIIEIKTFLEKLYNVGVRSLTIAMPSLYDLVKSMKYPFQVKTSTICQVTNADKALSFLKMGVNRIVLDESVNRDFLTLKRIQNRIGDKIELIANAICYKNCIYKMFHYNQMSCDSITVTNDVSINYYSHKCIMKRYENIANMLKLSWIRPEDIKYYTDIGIHFFKLQGRQAVLQGDPVRAVECYFKESYDGDLLELLDMFMPTTNFRVFVDNKSLKGFILPFIKNDNFCSSDCKNCNYCESFAKKAIDLKKAKEITEYAQNFYTEYDQFSKLINSDLPGIKVEKAKKKDKIKGFNFGK